MLRLVTIPWTSVFMAFPPSSAFHRFEEARVEASQFSVIELHVIPLVFGAFRRVCKSLDDRRCQYGSWANAPYDSHPAPNWKLRFIGLSLWLCTHLLLFSFVL